MNAHDFRTTTLGRRVEMNIKLIRNAMFVIVVIIVISIIGKVSAGDRTVPAASDAGHIGWVEAGR